MPVLTLVLFIMKSLKTLVLLLAGLNIAQVQAYESKQIGAAMMRLNNTPIGVDKTQFLFVEGGSVWANLRNNFRMNEVNSELVRRHEGKFAASSAYFHRTLERSRPYMYHISREVAKRNMPAEIALLPFIESAFVTKARSHVGASGLWQFMPATGRHYGLEQTPLYDGRHDIYAATDAALNYLEYLYGLFGDWSLALAAYNWGEGNVGRAINRARSQGLEPTYENLNMPAETRNYVPKLLAVRNIVNNPEGFGMRFADLENKPHFQAVNVDSPLDIKAAARLAQISESEFLSLNPAFKSPVYIPKVGRQMLLPISAVRTFEHNYNQADKGSLLSWQVYTPSEQMSLDRLSVETGMSVAELKRLNGISSNHVRAGQSILVSKNHILFGEAYVHQFAQMDIDRNARQNQLQVVPKFTRVTPNNQVATANIRPMTQEEVLSLFENKQETEQAMTIVVERNVAGSQALPASFQSNQGLAAPVQTLPTALSTEPLLNMASVETKATSTSTSSDTADTTFFQKLAQNTLSNTLPSTSSSTSMPSAPSVVEAKVAQGNQAVQTNYTSAFFVPAVAKKAAVAVDAAKNESTDELMTVLQSKMVQTESAANAEQIAPYEQTANVVQTVNQQGSPVVAVMPMASPKSMASNPIRTAAVAQTVEKQTVEQATPVVATRKTTPVAERKSNEKNAKPKAHKVEKGDTLYNIAQRYGMSVEDLMAVNRLNNKNIQLGQTLKVAGVSNAAPVQTANSKNQKATQKTPKIPKEYTVRKGDTLAEIAQRYQLDVSDLKRLNKNSKTLQVGQKVKLK